MNWAGFLLVILLVSGMKNSTPFLKPFGSLLCGRKPAKKVLEKDDLGELYEVFQALVPQSIFERPVRGANSRQRVLPPEVTFWAFVSQALSPGSACREVVRKLDAWWHWSGLDAPLSVSESGYCQARKRLGKETLDLIFRHLGHSLEKNVLQAERPIRGRSVKIVDGTMLSMPDTAVNQKLWPQNPGQKPGLGFPQLKLVGLFSLSSGALLDYATGSLYEHESTLFRTLWPRLSEGDILLGDRAFCSYGTMAALGERGVDCIWRLHHARKIDFRKGTRLGQDDRLVEWVKPGQRPPGLSPEHYAALPATLTVRMIRRMGRTAIPPRTAGQMKSFGANAGDQCLQFGPSFSGHFKSHSESSRSGILARFLFHATLAFDPRFETGKRAADGGQAV